MYKLERKLNPGYLLPCFGIMTKAFNAEEMQSITELSLTYPCTPGVITSEFKTNVVDHDIRSVSLTSLPYEKITEWLWMKVGDLIAQVNYDLFLYDVEYIQQIDYVQYNAVDNGHYSTHRDTHSGYCPFNRMISGVVMLSDTDEYTGGELSIDKTGTGDFETVTLNKGDAVFFSSYFSHKVLPVLSGTRKVLVFWALGKTQL